MTTIDKENARALDLKTAVEQFLVSLRALQSVRAAGVADGLIITDIALQIAGATSHITAADIGPVMSTIDALPTLLAGHLTNITKIAGR